MEYSQKRVKDILTDAFAIKERIENNAMLRAKSEKICKWCEYKNVCSENLLKVE